MGSDATSSEIVLVANNILGNSSEWGAVAGLLYSGGDIALDRNIIQGNTAHELGGVRIGSCTRHPD